MAYQAPYIGPAGLVVPVYSDILADIVGKLQSIFGQNIYLGQDSADYQQASVFSAKIADVLQAVQLAYNSRSPATAIGSALDLLVKMNGLARIPASPSTVTLLITGSANTIITNGYAIDQNENQWAFPSPVTIPSGGTLNVTASSVTPGPIAANINTITTRGNPTAGWTSVTNPAAASLGVAIESDAALRARQAISVALPSLTTVAATTAAIAAVPGVTRYLILENPTGSADSYGNPAHSITCVVEGGTNLAVATAIYNKRGIGALTNGTTSQIVVDSFTGTQFTVGFYRPTYVPIFVALSIHGLAGYTSATLALVQTAIANYLNSLQIGESITISALYGAALQVIPNLSLPTFSIRSLTAGTSSGSLSGNDIAVSFYQVAQGNTANVTVTAV